MKKLIFGISALIGALFCVSVVSGAGVNNPPTGNTVGGTTQQTSLYYVDGNRTDSYSQNGNILSPYKTMSGAVATAASDTYSVNVFALVPSNAPYVDVTSDTMPLSVYINGNQSTWVPVASATFPGAAEIYDTVIAGNLAFTSTSTTALHQINNSAIVSGNVLALGQINMIGTQMLSTTSTLMIASSGLMNYIGGQMDALVTAAAQSNYNDMEWNGSTSGYGITQTGCANGGCINTLGMTYINTAGDGISVNDGASQASGTENNLSFFSEILGASATSSVAAGTARTAICDSAGFYTVTGAWIAPVGSNWAPCFDESRVELNSLSVGTTTVTSNLVQIDTPSSTIRIGGTDNKVSCLEMYDTVTNNLEYVYTASNVLTATTTKPVFCQ